MRMFSSQKGRLKPPVETGHELQMQRSFRRNRLCEWYQWAHAWSRLIMVHTMRVWFLSWLVVNSCTELSILHLTL